METETKMFQTSSHNISVMLACVTSVSDRLRESWSEEEGFRFSLSRASCHSGAPRRHKFRAEAGVLFVNRRPIQYDLWEGVTTENHLCCHKSLTPYRWNVTKSINHQAKPVVSNKSYELKHWNCTKILTTSSVVCALAFGVNIPRSLSQVRETIYTSTEQTCIETTSNQRKSQLTARFSSKIRIKRSL